MKCNQSRPGFGLVSPCSFPTTITITPRAPPLYSKRIANFHVYSAYITWPEQIEPWVVAVLVSIFVVGGDITCCALLNTVCYLKVALVNEELNLIYKFKLSHNAYVKDKGTIDYGTITGWFKKSSAATTSLIKHNQVGFKPWILRPCSSYRSKSDERHSEKISQARYLNVLIVTFTNSETKLSGNIKWFLMLQIRGKLFSLVFKLIV